MDRIVCTKNPPLPPALTTYGFGFVCARDSYFFLKFKAINKLYCVDYINEYIIILSFSFFFIKKLSLIFRAFPLHEDSARLRSPFSAPERLRKWSSWYTIDYLRQKNQMYPQNCIDVVSAMVFLINTRLIFEVPFTCNRNFSGLFRASRKGPRSCDRFTCTDV